MKIGFSFFWQVLLNQPDPNHPEAWRLAFSDSETALEKLQQLGISSIEIKASEKVDVALFLQAVEKVIARGLDVTFHAAAKISYPTNYQWQLENVLEISERLNEQFNLKPLWVVHPLNSINQPKNEIYQNTITYLQELIEFQKNCPIKLALENLRNRPNNERKHAGDSYAEILKILAAVGDPQIKICWDFGHANSMFDQGLDSKFPPVDFLKQVVHCHVHDYLSEITHLPLGMGKVPLRDNLSLLAQQKYDGILNLEIVPYKIKNPSGFLGLVGQSVRLLKSHF